MFPRLGRPDARGAHARAAAVPLTRADDGRMSSEALRKIVAPVLRGAGVGDGLCHPHVLRTTAQYRLGADRRDGPMRELARPVLSAL